MVVARQTHEAFAELKINGYGVEKSPPKLRGFRGFFMDLVRYQAGIAL